MAKDPSKMTIEELEEQIRKDREEERKEREVHEAGMYTGGYRWSVDAFVHPAAGGDDYPITLYFTEKPSNEAIKAALKKQGSCLIEGQYSEPEELKDPNNKKEKVMTTKEKLAELNKLRVANNMKPLKSWKQSVAKLDAAINKLNAEAATEAVEEVTMSDVVEAAKAQAESTEEVAENDEEMDDSYIELKERFGTIKAASEFMLLEKDGDNEGLPYKFILRCIRTNFPKAKTSIACLRWYANKMNQAGTVMPPRKSGNRKK